MTDKIIFLDNDGVLNGDQTCRRPAILSGNFGLIDESYLGIDPKCVERVNKIVNITQAKIVLSTSWVIALGYEETVMHLRCNGLEGEILGATPRKMSSNRIQEIYFWLDRNREILEARSFVILDDDKKVLSSSWYGDRSNNFDDRVVLTNGHTGLTDQDVEKAINLLC